MKKIITPKTLWKCKNCKVRYFDHYFMRNRTKICPHCFATNSMKKTKEWK